MIRSQIERVAGVKIPISSETCLGPQQRQLEIVRDLLRSPRSVPDANIVNGPVEKSKATRDLIRADYDWVRLIDCSRRERNGSRCVLRAVFVEHHVASRSIKDNRPVFPRSNGSPVGAFCGWRIESGGSVGKVSGHFERISRIEFNCPSLIERSGP